MGANAGIAMLAFGTAYSAVGQYQAGQMNAETLRTNKIIADSQAADALLRGKVEEEKYRIGIKQLMGEQRAAIAAQGVDVNFGSALDLQLDAAYYGELGALTVRNNAQREAWGYEVQAIGYGMQASQSEYEGTFGAFSTLLGGGSQIFLNTRGLKVPKTETKRSSAN